MTNQNWLVIDDGHYRLYRFLTDLEDILKRCDDDLARLEAITPLVRWVAS